MSQQNVLEAAKQGNPNAIAALINRNLQQKGIVAKVSRKDSCLRIMLESREVPNQSSLVKFVCNGIKKIEVDGIETLQVFGRQAGDDVPSWSQIIAVGVEQFTTPQNQGQTSELDLNKSRLASGDETGFRVKHNGQEIVASDIEELKEWFHKGQITLADYAYNPILKKWMYVRELAEIESIVKERESSTQANQYNQTSFVFAGLGLLMLLVFPIAGVVLLVIAVVFSAMYYTQKGRTNSGTSLQIKISKSRFATSLLAILLGGFGIHFFYLRGWGWGLISILLCWTYLPGIAGLILGIRYLVMSDEEFERKAKKVKGAFGPIEF